jgi:tetratricopeptide (TPR) repeat protein
MNSQGWWEFTKESFQAEQWQLAEGALRRLLELHPANPEMLDLLSHTLLMQGRHGEAESVLILILQQETNNFWTPHKLGDALRGQHRLPEAAEAYEQALKRGSTSPLTPRNLLQVLDQLDVRKAIDKLDHWHGQTEFCQWKDLQPWQIGACDAALLSAGPELANWLINHGCDHPEIRQMVIREAAANLNIKTTFGLAEDALKERLGKLLQLPQLMVPG